MTAAMTDYEAFLRRKFDFHHDYGFDVDPADLSPCLLPHQRDIVVWAIKGGRRALFESFGLGKSVQQLEILRLIVAHLAAKGERARALIVCPLGVKQEFARDARELLGTTITFLRRSEEVGGDGLYLTNYESIRDGRLDPELFDAVSLDEASVLRSYGSKTYQSFLGLFAGTKYRFVATATPSPNRYKELIHYAGFLGVMDTGAALTRWFRRDSTHANNLTLHPHKTDEFFVWLHSWAIFLQRPSDLGYSDEGYDLPELEVVWHELPNQPGEGGHERDGQGRLYRDAALGVSEAAREKRDTLSVRVAKAKEIVDSSPDDHFILWHDLETERLAIEEAFPSATFGHWQEYRDGNAQALELYGRHYSARQYADGRRRELFMGPGEKTVLLSAAGDALFGWRKFKDDSGQIGVNCSVFRNEGPLLSSDLICEAMAIAWQRWPGERLYTYVDAEQVESSNPGYCFIKAGWTKAGTTKGGLQVLEALPGVEVPSVEPKPALLSVYGNLDLDTREERIIGFSEGEFRLLATKPTLSGSGCNFQRFCHRQIFVGVGFKFNDFIQAVHRCHRYLQPYPVRIDVIYAESEREVVKTLRRKWAQHKELTAQMSDLIRKHGLDQTSIAKALERSLGTERVEMSGEGWTLANNDCVAETQVMAMTDPESVDLIVTSIPFGNQYEYVASYNDFGHTDDNEHFWAQMDFLTPELLNILRPGRIYACHVKDRILFGNVTGAGYSTVSPFHAEALMHGLKHGFEFVGMITVVTDVVRENNQSYRLGWTEMAKDGTKMGVGSPEYVLLFRKPQSDRSRGYADVPVVKDKDAYSRARWQVDAHAFWRSSGDRPLTAEDMRGLTTGQRMKLFQEWSLANVHDHEVHVSIGEELDGKAGMGTLPATFMMLAPPSPHPDVWTDVNRMRTLNTEQSRRDLVMHTCPLQYDIVDRLIERYSNPGELVFDPFAGLGTVPLRALRAGRRGRGVELNPASFIDSVRYLKAEEMRVGTPSLFDLIDMEATEPVEMSA